jgi:hypothetical protein
VGAAFNVSRPVIVLPVFNTKLEISTPVAPATTVSTYNFVAACRLTVGVLLNVNGPVITSPVFKTKSAGLIALVLPAILAESSGRLVLGAVGAVEVEAGGVSGAKVVLPLPDVIRTL